MNQGVGTAVKTRRPMKLVIGCWISAVALVAFGAFWGSQTVSIPTDSSAGASCGSPWNVDYSEAVAWGKSKNAEFAAMPSSTTRGMSIPNFARLAERDCDNVMGAQVLQTVAFILGGLGMVLVGGLIAWAGARSSRVEAGV